MTRTGFTGTRSIWRAATMCLLLAATASAAAQETANVMQRLFTGPVTVSATGQAAIGELSGVTGPMAEAVRSQLAAMPFVAAQRDGVAVEQSAFVSGSAGLTPLPDGTIEMQLQRIALVPRQAAILTPPHYPTAQLRAGNGGSVELALRIGADGRIRDARTVASSGGDFEKAVRRAMREWRFQPVESGGDTEVSVPVWFHAEAESTPPKFECPLDPAKPHFAGQNGCLDLIEVVATP